MNKQYNAGLYLRLSLEDEDNSSNRRGGNPFKAESTSIENQRDILKEYVYLNGWNVAKVYTDDGFSGGSFNRPAFQEMLHDVKIGLIDLVLVKDLSRFGRDHIEVDCYVEDVFPRFGVRFIALMDGIDSEGGTDILPFRSLMNDYYLKDLSRKIKSVFVEKAKAGNFIGRFAPYGYAKDPERHGRLMIEPYAANVVRRIFDLRVQRYGLAKIANLLNSEGIMSPKSYFFNKEVVSNLDDKQYIWRESQIKRVLQNEVYLGHSVRMKQGHLSYKNKKKVKRNKDEWIRVEDTHEPLVSQEIWDAANSVSLIRYDPDSKKTPEPKLFAGLLQCDNGHSMGGGTDNQRYKGVLKKYTHYFCTLHKQSGRTVCSWHNISEIALLRIIREDMKKQLEEIEINENRILSEIQNHLSGTSLEDMKRNQQRVSVKLDDLDEQSAKLYEDRLRGKISLDQFISLSASIDSERSNLQAERERLSAALETAEQQVLNYEQLNMNIQTFLSLERPDRKILREIIDKIVIGECKSNKTGKERQQDIKIIYRYTGFIN